MESSDPRIQAIQNWLTNDLNLNIQQFEPASADASFRRYFRLTHEEEQKIIMDAPPDKEDLGPFIKIARLFKKTGINVPEIYHEQLEQGFLLLEDFGCRCYLDALTEDNADSLYQKALNSLFSLHTMPKDALQGIPLYDDTLLEKEIELFHEWFLKQRLNLSMPLDISQQLSQLLINNALEQPRVCVHRDYHSRNLMVTDKHSPGIIDFQDAVVGAITYDLVSLLKDCYIAWPDARVNDWLKTYYHRLVEQQLIQTDFSLFRRWFDLMGLQRHLKAIGIFSRLNNRDNKPQYLNDIPLTMNYVCNIARKYPELECFNQYLHREIMPTYQHCKS